MNLTPILDQAIKALHDHHYDQVRDILKNVPLSAAKTPAPHSRQEQVQLMRCHYIMGEVSIFEKDFAESVKRLLEAYRLAVELEDMETAWRSREIAGNALREQNLPGIALEHHTWCSNFLEENTLNASTEKQMRLYYALALDYHALERYSEAIECYQHTIEFSRQHNNTEYLAKAYRGLAVVQYNQDNLTFTRVYAYQAIGVSETINEVDAIIRLKGGLARALAKHNQTDEALYNAQEAFELAEQTGDLPNILTAYVNLSNVTMQAKNFEQALEYAQAGVAKLKKAEDSKAKVDKITAGYVFGQLAAVLNRRGREKDRNQVRKHMDKALNYLQQSPFNQYLSSMYYNYAQVLEEWGELAEALQYIKKAVALGYATKPPVLEF